MKLNPIDFDNRPAHFLELDGLSPETFDEYVQRHLLLLSYAYTVAEGAANPAVSLSDGYVERIYTPDDFNPEGGPEDNQQFLERVRGYAVELSLKRMFYHGLMSMKRRSASGLTETVDSMLWYAKDVETGERRVGSMDPIDNEGHHRVLNLSQPGNIDRFTGWLAGALAEIL